MPRPRAGRSAGRRTAGTAAHPLAFGGDAVLAEHAGEEPYTLLVLERRDPDRPRARDEQLAELAVAGHDDRAGGGGGKQRCHLGGVLGVVQQHEQPQVGRHGAEHGRPFGQLRRDPSSWTPNARRNPPRTSLTSVPPRWRSAPKSAYSSAVAEPFVDLVRPAAADRALAHSLEAADHRDRGSPFEETVEQRQLGGPVDEAGRHRGQLAGDPYGRRGRGAYGHGPYVAGLHHPTGHLPGHLVAYTSVISTALRPSHVSVVFPPRRIVASGALV